MLQANLVWKNGLNTPYSMTPNFWKHWSKRNGVGKVNGVRLNVLFGEDLADSFGNHGMGQNYKLKCKMFVSV